jgi:hypothetical protein
LSFPVAMPSSFAKSMLLTKRTVLASAESVGGRGSIERGGTQNVSSHVGSTRFGAGGTRGDARPEPEGVGETDVCFVPLRSSGFLSGFTFGFEDGDGERGGAGIVLCGSRAATPSPARVSEVATSATVLLRSSSPSLMSITSIVSSARCSASVMRLASRDLELRNEVQPETLAVMEDWMGFAGSTCVVEAVPCTAGASLAAADSPGVSTPTVLALPSFR